MNSETKQRPILFSTPMVQANLEDRKTVTRRTSGLDYINSLGDKITFGMCAMGEDMTHTPPDPPGLHAYFGNEETDDWWQPIKCPYGNVGDILWIRETWTNNPLFGQMPNMPKYLYKATDTPMEEGLKWKPSIHMPYEACRLFLQITDIKVERLQDITEEQAIAEGIESNGRTSPISWRNYLSTGAKFLHSTNGVRFTPKESFQSLWESINGAGSWEANPWAWVISFKRIDKPAQ